MVVMEEQSENSFFDYIVEQESFSGPLDLLLHLIRKDEVDIFEINISYSLKSNTLLFTPIISEKKEKKSIPNFDISDSFFVEKFLEICDMNNINDKDSLINSFPNNSVAISDLRMAWVACRRLPGKMPYDISL